MNPFFNYFLSVFFRKFKLAICFAISMLVWFEAHAQVSILSASTYTETFTGFVGGSTPANWFVQGTGTSGTSWRGTGQTSGSSGGWYGNANMSFLGSGTAINGNGTWQLQNNTGSSIVSFTISFTARLWKSGTASPAVNVYWLNQASSANPAQGAGGFSNLASLNFNDATTNISTGAALSQNVTGLNIPNGDYIYIRFIHAGNSNSDNLGWDDVSITPTLCAFPNITSQPVNASACPGNNASFSVLASGSPTYQWQVSTNGGGSWSNLVLGAPYSNVTSSTLNITGVTLGMNGYQYRCVVSSGCPINSNAVTLTVWGSSSITSQPSNAVACIGTNTSFFVGTLAGALTFQWQVSTDGGLSYSNLTNVAPYSNVTTATLNITSVSPGLNGNLYQCVVSNGGCSAPVTSSAATLTAGGPTFIINPGSASTCTNGTASFSVLTSGSAPTYVWEVSTNGGGSWSTVPGVAPYSGNNTATLTINPAAIGMNNYQYHCIVTDAGCPATSTAATLTVSSGPVIFTQPSNVITPAGNNAIFSVNAGNVTSYQWEESTDGGASWNPLVNTPPYSGVTSATLIISGVTVSMNGYMYHCVLNGCSATLTSNAATLIIGAPGGTTLLPGDLIFVGYDSKDNCTSGSGNASTDKFYVANLVDLAPGTKFKIVNSRFESGAAAGVRTNRWYGSGDDPYEAPGFAEFQVGATTIPKGSIITFYLEVPSPTATNVLNVRVNNVATANLSVAQTSGTCNISSSDPDQIYLMQLSSTVGSEAWNSRDLKSRPH